MKRPEQRRPGSGENRTGKYREGCELVRIRVVRSWQLRFAKPGGQVKVRVLVTLWAADVARQP